MRPSHLVAVAASLAFAFSCSPSNETPDAGGGDSDGGAVDSDGGADAGGAVDAGPATCDLATFDNENGIACEGVTEGTCRPGARFCDENGFLTSCFNRRQPVPGDCTRLNCLGELNEGCTCILGAREECYSGDEDTLGRGICRRGVQLCDRTETGSSFGECKGEALPLAEDCSNRNLDCSAGEEEGACACTGNTTRPCGGVVGGTCAVGTQTCTGTVWGECQNYVQPVAGDCSVESCLGGPNPGCDCTTGDTEDCYTGLPGTLGVGTCAKGTRSCVDGRWSAECVGQVAPRPFFCAEPSCAGGPNPGCD